MIEVIHGENYFIDLDEIERYCDMSDSKTDPSGNTETRINVVKFEMIKLLMEVVLADEIFPEDTMGLKNTKPQMTIPFKLAFNSLLNKKIIKYF